MTARRLPTLALLAVLAAAPATAEDAPNGRFDASVDLPKDTPYVGEPLRLVLRTALHAPVANDRIEQPALTDFDWQQYGIDASSEELVDGFWTPVHTRTLMLYPLRAGRLTIEPFKWRVSYFTRDGARTEIALESQPLSIEVRARESLGDPADAWLPAKALRLVDRWEPEPDRIPFGETAKRTVAIEAEGLTADRLPPLPRFRAPGLITFAGPVERQTLVTDRGPVARAVYQWTVRPASASAAVAPAIRLRWFDVATRIMREAEAPERRVAFLGATPERGAAGATQGLLAPRPLIAALLGFVAAGAATWLAASSPRGRAAPWRRVATAWRSARALRRAAHRNNVADFRRALTQISKADPEAWRRIAARDDLAAALAEIDAALFARRATPGPEQEPPAPLVPLANKIAAALRRDVLGDIVLAKPRPDMRS